jgi:ATP-dependent protease ClpP protease subunit
VKPDPSGKKTTYIKFFAFVDQKSVNALVSAVSRKIPLGVQRFVVLISSLGGSVFHGLSAYNFLKGLPVEVVTHNFGSVDSIAGVLFCAGSKRYSVPHARFLLHPVSLNIPGPANLSDKNLEEMLKGLKIDQENIAGVIAATAGKSEADILKAIQDRTTLSPEEAIAFGLVHEIKEGLIPEDADLVTILAPDN